MNLLRQFGSTNCAESTVSANTAFDAISLARELSVLLLLEELGELGLEVLGVLAHLLVELVGVLLDHLLELLVVLLHLRGEGALVGLVGEELLVLLFHLLGEFGVEAVELVGELLEGGAHFLFGLREVVGYRSVRKTTRRKHDARQPYNRNREQTRLLLLIVEMSMRLPPPAEMTEHYMLYVSRVISTEQERPHVDKLLVNESGDTKPEYHMWSRFSSSFSLTMGKAIFVRLFAYSLFFCHFLG